MAAPGQITARSVSALSVSSPVNSVLFDCCFWDLTRFQRSHIRVALYFALVCLPNTVMTVIGPGNLVAVRPPDIQSIRTLVSELSVLTYRRPPAKAG